MFIFNCTQVIHSDTSAGTCISAKYGNCALGLAAPSLEQVSGRY